MFFLFFLLSKNVCLLHTCHVLLNNFCEDVKNQWFDLLKDYKKIFTTSSEKRCVVYISKSTFLTKKSAYKKKYIDFIVTSFTL